MRTTMTMTPSVLTQVMNTLTTVVEQPVAALANYYSRVLERQVSCRQTWQLLNAQLAFFVTVFSSCGLLLRFACILWLVSALLRCKAVFSVEERKELTPSR